MFRQGKLSSRPGSLLFSLVGEVSVLLRLAARAYQSSVVDAKEGELKQKASKFHRFLALPYPLMRVLLIFSQTGIGLPIENTVSRTISENPKALILRVCS